MLDGYVGEYSFGCDEREGTPGYFYRVLCDGCTADLTDTPGSEASGWDDPCYAIEQSEAEVVTDLHLCDRCRGALMAAYSEVEWMALTEPMTEGQGVLTRSAARGWLRHNVAAPVSGRDEPTEATTPPAPLLSNCHCDGEHIGDGSQPDQHFAWCPLADSEQGR